MTETLRLPQRVRKVIDRCAGGQPLCMGFKVKTTGDLEIVWHFEPCGKAVGPDMAKAAVDSGYLEPQNDGLPLGDCAFSQTWRAKA